MRHASLFTGIGGFDLAAEWMGWENVFHCEINKFGQKVLRYYWPNATIHDDIKATDFSIYRGQIDIVSGGFPCQPYSTAGKRKGKDDERHLWPEMLRAIREIQPAWVVGENVLGLVSWSGGLVFEEVQSDLEAEGYEVQAYVLPAAGVGAPHRRDRVWFVANSESNGNSRGLSGLESPYDCKWKSQKHRENHMQSGNDGEEQYAPHSNSVIGCKGGLYETGPKEAKRHPCAFDSRKAWNAWEVFPTQPPICSRDDGLSSRLDAASLFEGAKPRNGNPFGKWRNESIKAGGNAIVPQIALQIFKAIQEYENITNGA